MDEYNAGQIREWGQRINYDATPKYGTPRPREFASLFAVTSNGEEPPQATKIESTEQMREMYTAPRPPNQKFELYAIKNVDLGACIRNPSSIDEDRQR